MTNDPRPPDEVDPRRVRIGLAMLVAVVVVALVAAAKIDNPTARVVMLGIVAFTVIRAYLLTRSLRQR